MKPDLKMGAITKLFEEIQYLQEAEELLEELFYIDIYALDDFVDKHDKYKNHTRLITNIRNHFRFDDSE